MINYDDIQIKQDSITRVKYLPVIETKQLNLTVEQLEKQINKMAYFGQNPKYGFNKIYDQKLEHSYIPQFADSFYNYIFENGRLPTQKEFWDFYLLSNKEHLTSVGDKIKVNFMSSHFFASRKGYIARVLRTYPSLLRDFHFIVMLKNDDFFKDKFYYSLVNDYNKIDIMVIYNEKEYKIGLDVNTKRCNHFREMKQNRHEKDDVYYISIDLNNGKRLGCSQNSIEQFIVYPISALEQIKQMLFNDN